MLKIVDWNINGGYLKFNERVENNFQFFIDKIKELTPDIVFIQEGHISKDFNQAEFLSKELDLPYYIHKKLGVSHIEKDNQLCLFILSKFELRNESFFEFTNPNIELYNKNHGGDIDSKKHIKGILSAEIYYNNKVIKLLCSHAHALHIFNKNYLEYPKLVSEIKSQINKESEKNLIIFGGDMNNENFLNSKKDIFSDNIKSLFNNVITFKNYQSDYALISKEFRLINQNVDFCTEDHALLFFSLEID